MYRTVYAYMCIWIYNARATYIVLCITPIMMLFILKWRKWIYMYITYTYVYCIPMCTYIFIFLSFIQLIASFVFHSIACLALFTYKCILEPSATSYYPFFFSFSWLHSVQLYKSTVNYLANPLVKDIWTVSNPRWYRRCFREQSHTCRIVCPCRGGLTFWR